jgi:hypothetical protein
MSRSPRTDGFGGLVDRLRSDRTTPPDPVRRRDLKEETTEGRGDVPEQLSLFDQERPT